MRKLLIIVGLAVSCYIGLKHNQGIPLSGERPANTTTSDDVALTRAYESGASGVQVQGQGRVMKILSDDNNGSRHQRFILKLQSGQTLLVAHNIDIAPRIDSLQVGDEVLFDGEYEWNNQGGVIHWTHRDPNGRHISGWLQHNGNIFQ